MDYANLIKMLMGGASGGASGSSPLSSMMGGGSKAPASPTVSPSASPASSAGGNPMGMLSGLFGGGSKEEGPNPNLEAVKIAGTSMLGEGNSDEYMAKMNALRNMRNR